MDRLRNSLRVELSIPVAQSQDRSRVVAAARLTRDGIPIEGHHLARRQCIRQAGLVLLERSLGLLALRDVDVGTDETCRCSIAIVGYEAA